MHAMETDDFHALRYLNADPLCFARSPPLLIKNRQIALIQETDSINIAVFSLFLTHIYFNSTDFLFGIDRVNLGVKRSPFNRVNDLTFNIVRESHFDLVQVRIGLKSEARQLDCLVKRQFLQILLLRPLEFFCVSSLCRADRLCLAETWFPIIGVLGRRLIFFRNQTNNFILCRVCNRRTATFHLKVGLHQWHSLQFEHPLFELFPLDFGAGGLRFRQNFDVVLRLLQKALEGVVVLINHLLHLFDQSLGSFLRFFEIILLALDFLDQKAVHPSYIDIHATHVLLDINLQQALVQFWIVHFR